jgi:hypothetical protein
MMGKYDDVFVILAADDQVVRFSAGKLTSYTLLKLRMTASATR